MAPAGSSTDALRPLPPMSIANVIALPVARDRRAGPDAGGVGVCRDGVMVTAWHQRPGGAGTRQRPSQGMKRTLGPRATGSDVPRTALLTHPAQVICTVHRWTS